MKISAKGSEVLLRQNHPLGPKTEGVAAFTPKRADKLEFVVLLGSPYGRAVTAGTP